VSRENQADTIESWRRLLAMDEEAKKYPPHLKKRRAKLAAMYKRLVNLRAEQAALAAAKQKVSQEIQTTLEEGRVTATFLRAGLRDHFGNRSERLIEFGVRPFRGGRPRKKKEADAD
jgi:hypothetical protein